MAERKPLSNSSDTIVVLHEKDREEFGKLGVEYQRLKNVEAQEQQALLKVMEPRAGMISKCIEACKQQYPDSFKMRQLIQEKTKKEVMDKARFREFSREEFDKNFLYGFEPILKAQDYTTCHDKCEDARKLSGRAGKLGQSLISEYYAKCLETSKRFDHVEHHWEIDKFIEIKCSVTRQETSIAYLRKMQAEFKEKNARIFDNIVDAYDKGGFSK